MPTFSSDGEFGDDSQCTKPTGSGKARDAPHLQPTELRRKYHHYQIELLTNLDKLPEAGAIAVAAFPKPNGGSGFPARVFAILP